MLSRDGSRMAYSSTSRNGTDRDIWLHDPRGGEPRLLLQEGGSWSAQDFSPDGSRLLVMKYVSANESYPGEVDVATGKLRMFPVDGGKAAFGDYEAEWRAIADSGVDGVFVDHADLGVAFFRG